MRLVIAGIVLLAFPAATFAQVGRDAGTVRVKEAGKVLLNEDLRVVSPALEKYMRGPLSDLWKLPDLSPRDRSMVTVAALIGRNRAQSDGRTGAIPESRARQRRQAGRNIGDHHPSCLLLRVAECVGRGVDHKSRFHQAQSEARSVATGAAGTAADR